MPHGRLVLNFAWAAPSNSSMAYVRMERRRDAAVTSDRKWASKFRARIDDRGRAFSKLKLFLADLNASGYLGTFVFTSAEHMRVKMMMMMMHMYD